MLGTAAPVTRLLAYAAYRLNFWWSCCDGSRGRMGGSTKNRSLRISVLARSGTGIARRPCGTSAFQLISSRPLELQRRREVSRKGRWVAFGEENARTNTKEAFSHSHSAAFFFFFKRRSAMRAPPGYCMILPSPLSYINMNLNALSRGLPISSASCRPPLPSGSSVSLPLLFARPGISSVARLVLMP
jgi:hypothetical protein